VVANYINLYNVSSFNSLIAGQFVRLDTSSSFFRTLSKYCAGKDGSDLCKNWSIRLWLFPGCVKAIPDSR